MLTFHPVHTEADCAAIAALADRIWRHHYTAIIGMAQVDYMLERFQSPRAIAAQIQAGYYYRLVTGAAGEIGYFAVQPHGESLFLSKFYVLAGQRGQGYGRQMMAEIERIAQEQGCDRITLTVNKHNEQTLAIYQKLGFTVEDAIVTDIGGGFVMDDFRLVKALRTQDASKD
ncbi:GNAT family N-acetyltransferase [Spirulina major CS-329]|uniref:GNAT family N-acetyltransferase n=1 Tax=Spirulina TaxID=1154 RepID=UPI00232BE6CD|nr:MULTISPECIES: GNAT family N-acetyltransferase [Spirulina]MDB9496718.1 GNAT family N-acetyltransferase [Spirulina subsalsa CS-330]MDB9503193.1 GNAT family N-acetyltransferase [Spirulina major CS-329]